jgi:hypothetical protein
MIELELQRSGYDFQASEGKCCCPLGEEVKTNRREDGRKSPFKTLVLEYQAAYSVRLVSFNLTISRL